MQYERPQTSAHALRLHLNENTAGCSPRVLTALHRLTREQEEELMSDPALLLVAVSALHQMRVEEIMATYQLDEAQCVRALLRLEKIGILELHENNRIRLRIARTFSWIPEGPIMRYVKAQLPDFFDHPFDRPGQLMHMISIRLSRSAQVALLQQLEQLAREYSEQHNADARLPLDQRQPVSVLLAVRPWEPELFKSLRR